MINGSIVKLEPAFKDYLWGGTKLRDIYNKKCDMDIVAESWELSAHPDGTSRIASGQFKGMLFTEDLEKIGVSSVVRGVFGADMTIDSVADGPVTVMLDTEDRSKK